MLILTRDLEKSLFVAEKLNSNGIKNIISPLFKVEKKLINEDFLLKTLKPLNFNFLQSFHKQDFGIVITSDNACDTIISLNPPKDTPIFSISIRAALKLVNNNFINIISAEEKNAKNLAQTIAKYYLDRGSINKIQLKKSLLFYFCGNKVAVDLEAEIDKIFTQSYLEEKFRPKIISVIAYNIVEKHRFSKEFIELLENYVNLFCYKLPLPDAGSYKNNTSVIMIPLFSSNSAKIFCQLLDGFVVKSFGNNSFTEVSLFLREILSIFCISDSLLHEMNAKGFAKSYRFKDLPFSKDVLNSLFLTW
jgi:hypothetical protein